MPLTYTRHIRNIKVLRSALRFNTCWLSHIFPKGAPSSPSRPEYIRSSLSIETTKMLEAVPSKVCGSPGPGLLRNVSGW